jgi:hypothetical protein
MVTVKYHIGISDPLDFLYTNATDLASSSNKKAIWTDVSNLNSITAVGEKLQSVDGVLVSGTIEKITFKDAEGLAMVTINGEYKNVKQIDESIGTSYMDERLFAGNDKFFGSGYTDSLLGHKGNDKLVGRGGADHLWGGRGEDRMTGGADSDIFYFTAKSLDYKGDGHDVITDFDAIGLDGEQDYLDCSQPISIKKSGDDTVLTFEGGGTLTLLDVKRSDITDADFNV